MEKRVNRLRNSFETAKVDAFLITSEYNRRYVSLFSGTTAHLLITSEEALLITDFRYLEQAVQEAPYFKVVNNQRKMMETVAEEVKKRKIKRLGFEENHISFGEYQKWLSLLDGVELVPMGNTIEKLRLYKDEGELEKIKKAARIADEAFAHVLHFIRPGVTENEVAAELEYQMRKLGASGPSFDTIVASGYRSAMPHGKASEKRIETGELVTLDFGAIYQGYVSDLTRTVAVGEISPKLKEIYEICLEAQLTGIRGLGPGMTGKEADAVCRDFIQAKGYGEAFGHGTGHGIGLEIHEDPTLSLSGEMILEPGMVVTVEPGIYLPGIGGVRIEDDILITEEGNEVLTKSKKELIQLG